MNEETLTLEEDVVADYLTLEDEGGSLLLEAGDEQIILADTENHSKRDIRAFEEKVRTSLEALAYEATNRLRTKISEERRQEIEPVALTKAKEKIKHLEKVISEDKRVVIYLRPEKPPLDTGWVVVDTTWKRGPLHLCPKASRLSSASEDYPPTVFATERDANLAIEDTKRYDGGIYAWSNNNFVAVEVF